MNPLDEANKALDRALETERRNKLFIESIGPAIVNSLKPAIQEGLKNIDITVNPNVTLPPMEQPDIHVAAPIVNVPESVVNVTVPPIKVPKATVNVSVPTKALTNEMRRITEAVKTQPIPMFEVPEYTFAKPIPSILVDAKGKPMDIGGGQRAMSLMRFMDSDGESIPVSAANPLPTSATLSITDTLDVKQVSGANWSTYVTGAAASTYAEMLNPDGRVKVELPTGSSALTDTELRAASIPVAQVSGANWSTSVTNTVTVDGSGVTQPVSAASLPLPSGAATAAAQLPDGHNVTVDNASIAVTGTFYQATQPVSATQSFETKQVSGFAESVFVTGSADSMMAYKAMTTNPTAVSDGADVRPKTDDIGRQVFTPIQVRDLRATAYVSLSTGTETTLLAGAASTFHDLIYVMGANQSNAAVTVDFRSGTAGSVQATLEIPANATAGIAPVVAIPMSEVAQAWTVDMPDITGTTVDITAQFSKEV